VGPARYRCCLPQSSAGWTFAWIRIDHPFLVERLAKDVKANGPIIEVPPTGTLCAAFLRLVRGALKKDFRDHFDAELALWEFVLMYERRQHEMADECGQGQRLLDAVRARIVASLPQSVGVDALAEEYSMSRSHFSHFFRTRTGLTPARFATSVRIQEAARLLRETRAPLKCIADLCGFANANHFCKVFRRFQQLSPASFRRTVR
jgi:transcriptional regulator GlxA family with amidase domain